MREAKPDVILIYPYPADGARVVRTIHQLGLKLPMVMARSGLIETMRKLAGEASDGIVVPTTVDTGREDVRKFFATYNARFKPIQPTYYSIIGYDAGTLAIRLLALPEVQKAISSGNLAEARKAIRDATEKYGQFKGLQGPAGATYQFSAAQHQGAAPNVNWFVFTQVAEKGTRLVKADLAKFKPKP